MREAIKDYGSAYWEYVLLYVDDALCISMNDENVLNNEIGGYFLIKIGSVRYPNIYIGNKVSKVTLDNRVEGWSFSSSQHVHNDVSNVEIYIKNLDMKLPKKAPAPFTSDYRPDIDINPKMNSKKSAYYQSLIVILRYTVELGRVDITVETSLMASCMAMSCRGNLDQLFHIFVFFCNKFIWI